MDDQRFTSPMAIAARTEPYEEVQNFGITTSKSIARTHAGKTVLGIEWLKVKMSHDELALMHAGRDTLR